MCLGAPGRVVETYREHELLMGRVDFGGIIRRVCLEHVPEVAIGDHVLVHVGFALTRLDEEEAQRLLDHLRALGEAVGPEAVDEVC